LDGKLTRFDGFLMLNMFLAWFVAVVIEARKQRSAAEAILGEHRGWLVALPCVAGLAFNGIFIVAVAAIIFPITVAWREVAITLMFGLLALVFTYPTRK
jgi:hypothetical protein